MGDVMTGSVAAKSSDGTTLALNNVKFSIDNNGVGTWAASITTPKNLAAGTTITVTCFGMRTDGTTVIAVFAYTVK